MRQWGLMRRWSLGSLILTLLIGVAGWLAVFYLCLCIGSNGTGFPTVEQMLIRKSAVLTASIVGAALAASGVVYQAILRNPLADPYLLGVSTGAALASYIWRLPLGAKLLAAVGLAHSPVSQQTFAFCGALVSMVVVFSLSTRRGRLEPLTLLLVGVIVNVVNAAIFLLINEIVRDQSNQANFIVGGLQTIDPSTRHAVAAICGVGLVALIAMSGSLNVAVLSEAEAISLGVRIHRLRWVALIIASLMTASVVAISGPIGFVGLICPHLARLIVGTDQRKLLPIATAGGAMLLAAADAVSRGLAQERFIGTVLPVGIVTALMGGPFFLLLLIQARRERGGDGA